jgi:hypothetical protein
VQHTPSKRKRNCKERIDGWKERELNQDSERIYPEGLEALTAVVMKNSVM